MIINQLSGSGGDALPWYFRKAGIGPLIGKRTWGGLVGIYDYPALMDGGRVTGDVTAHQRLELRAASRVQGNISSPSLVVQEGAFFEGQCSMAAAETNATRDKTDPAGPLRRARDNVATTTATATAAVAAQS